MRLLRIFAAMVLAPVYASCFLHPLPFIPPIITTALAFPLVLVYNQRGSGMV